MKRPPVPSEIRRLGDRGLRVLWEDGHQSEYANFYLRENCPCAFCKQRRKKGGEPVVAGAEQAPHPVRMGVVGHYAVSIQWSDGHKTGIYSYRVLRELCPCDSCSAGGARASGTEA